MNIAVLGADGRTGRAFVELALAAGHKVRGGVHNTAPNSYNPNLTYIKCDATVDIDVENLLQDQHVVVSLLGHVKGTTPNMQTQAMKNVIVTMRQNGIKRLISLTGTGVRLEGDVVTPLDKILNISIAIIDPARVKDGKDHFLEIQQSGLEWTVIRVLKLQTNKQSKFTLTEHGPTKPYVSRQDVAKAILQVITDHSFVMQAPILS